MYSGLTWAAVGGVADAFVSWLAPVALLAGGLGLALGLVGVVLRIVSMRGGEAPHVGNM